MTEQKVYALQLEDIGDVEYTRNHLGRKFTILSDIVKETIYFHDFTYPTTTGAPVMLLECSPDFLKRIQGEAMIVGVFDMSDVPTQRSAALMERYKNAAPPPYPEYKKKPKFGP